jgi:hypothetical protein
LYNEPARRNKGGNLRESHFINLLGLLLKVKTMVEQKE